MINGQTNFLTEVTSNTDDYQAQKIYTNLGVQENMYKFQANYNSAFFVCENSGTTYIFDAGGNGKIGCGVYLLKNGIRAETWRIGGLNNSSNVVHSSNGEDWATL